MMFIIMLSNIQVSVYRELKLLDPCKFDSGFIVIVVIKIVFSSEQLAF
jgi:hypothetical protein